MMTADSMFTVFERSIDDYHQTDDVDASMHNPYPKDSFEYLLYRKNWIDTVQWHLEDIIRNPEIDSETALKIKRRIDASNQDRTDLVEKIDDHYLEQFHDIQASPEARVNTESPAWAIDRLSILSLKIYHMRIEAERSDISKELQQKNEFKYNVLRTQQTDLSIAIDQLLEDLQSGNRIMKVYRQMKMYNDPELNPVLYAQNKD
tara:strand:+ start:3827 stop:4438 length:612 start_codon:yes stop_codon:yes gene_type:complete